MGSLKVKGPTVAFWRMRSPTSLRDTTASMPDAVPTFELKCGIHLGLSKAAVLSSESGC